MYHQIFPEITDDQKSSVSVAQFKDHLKTLQDNGYHIITMKQFHNFIVKGKSVPDKSVLITFDDGYETFYTYAYPALKEAKATGSVFIIGAYTDMFNPDAFPHLTWDQMRELKKNGMGVYNHSYNSHNYAVASEDGTLKKAQLAGPLYLPINERMETAEDFRQRAYSDIAFMEKRLKDELGAAPGILSLPYGAYSQDTLEAGKQAGITLYFTIKPGLNKPGQLEALRINAGKPNFSGEQLVKRLDDLRKQKALK